MSGNILDEESQKNRQKQTHHAGKQYIQSFIGLDGRKAAFGGLKDLDVLYVALFEFQVFHFLQDVGFLAFQSYDFPVQAFPPGILLGHQAFDLGLVISHVWFERFIFIGCLLLQIDDLCLQVLYVGHEFFVVDFGLFLQIGLLRFQVFYPKFTT